MSGIETWSAARASEIIAGQQHLDGATLPILHALQHAFGYVDPQAVPLIADALNLSKAEVFGTISFYHDFRSKPAGRHVLKLCRAEACQAMGAVALHQHCRTRHGIDWHDTTPDGELTLEPVFCLGLCATAPAALLDDKPLARLTTGKIDAQIEGLPR
ncbi:formate dehydrogenase subunit gamma [Lichenihabitans psoromatis]|uniref:formate dehydrogenase subunit gamma n=1 Tax=Lichenihabitans psoromatis TaxID=2528642 RepID=UPI0010384B63|nr:formate dehydrogenase subunit gamma [Lichenihabitans psoromatis]